MVRVQYIGDREVQDNVVQYFWSPADINDVPSDVADRLLTNGNFTITDSGASEAEDDGASEEERLCVGEKADGSPCERTVFGDDEYCWQHAPDNDDREDPDNEQ